MKVAIIPARGGSKRIFKKNIKAFMGKPIISYSIEAAIKSNCFDRVIVSTDDKEIAEVAKQFEAEVPFMRPDNIADDFTGTNAVVAHALTVLGSDIEFACCIYATAPFVTPELLKQGVNMLQNDSNVDFAVSVTNTPFPLNRALQINNDLHQISMINSEHIATRSQDLVESYYDAGQVYWGRAEAFIEQRAMFQEKTAPLIIQNCFVQDIDTEDDWQQAEIKYKVLKEQGLI